jgi:hypothetical protein
MNDAVQDIVTSKTATGVTVAGSVLGLTFSEWAAVVTVVFVLYQFYSLRQRNKRERELHEKLMAKDDTNPAD